MNLREIPWRANIRGEGVLGLAARNDRMLVERASQSHEGSSAGYLGITMEITTRLGSHTIAVASSVGRFVSTRASDTAPRSLGAAVSSSFTYLFFSPFRVLPYGWRWSAYMHGRTREKANDPGLSYSFVPLAKPRGHCVPHCRSSSRLFSPWNYHFLVLSTARSRIHFT